MTDGGAPVIRATGVGLDDLDATELARWHVLRHADPRWQSPFFAPEFAAAVHRSGRPVTVVVTGAGEEARGFWPVHVERSVVRPVGWPASDFQGPVGEVGPDDVLRATGGRSLRFDHLADLSGPTGRHVREWRASPFIDVTGGLEGYLGRASRSGRDNLAQARRKLRKAESRYGGPVRFTLDDRSSGMLDQLVALKRGQYAATGARDYFARPERLRMLQLLHGGHDAGCTGMLSTLTCEGRLLAAHFGLVDGPVLHWWFPTYASEAADLSPGWMLLRELIAAAPGRGVTRIDLGRGEDEYKRRAMTGAVRVGEGVVARAATARIVESWEHQVRAWIRSTGGAPMVRRALGSGR